MSQTVSVSIQDRVAIVTIERPQHRNAVDLPTAEALLAAFKSFDANKDAHVAILTGAGGAFCAGAVGLVPSAQTHHRVQPACVLLRPKPANRYPRKRHLPHP